MEKPSMEHIDKLFNCMAEFYGNRWTSIFDRWHPESLAKTLWQSALQGLSYDEIKGVLLLLRQAAKSPAAFPPTFLEFYAFAKGTAKPFIDYRAESHPRCNPEVAKRALAEINAKLRFKKPALECSM